MKHWGLTDEEADRLWSTLYKCIDDVYPNRSAFDSFRKFITPPPSLNGFVRIAENFLAISEQFHHEIKTQPYFTGAESLETWKELCKILITRADKISLSIPRFSDHSGDGDPPYRGYYETHCLGVALWCVSPNEALKQKFLILQATLCEAIKSAQKLSIQKQFTLKLQPSNACLAVRKLATPDKSYWLSLLPDEPNTLLSYWNHLSRLIDNSAHIFYPLQHLIEIAIGMATISTRRYRERNRRKFQESTIETYPLDFGIDHSPQRSAKISTHISGDNQTKSRRRNALLHEEEFKTQRSSIAIETEGKDPSGGLSASQQHLKAKEAVSHISMSNQRLPFTLNQLARHEVALFLDELDVLATTPGSINGILNQEVAVFCTIAFWTSRTTSEVTNTKLTPAIFRVDQSIAICRDKNGSCFFVVSPFTTPLKTDVEKNARSQALQLARRYDLTIPERAMKILGPWLDQITFSYELQDIFHHVAKKYEDAIDDFFKYVRKKHDCRLNANRAFKYMHDLISGLPKSDITVAMAISGRSDNLGKVNLHYTAHAISTIKHLYQCAVTKALLTPISACTDLIDHEQIKQEVVTMERTPDHESAHPVDQIKSIKGAHIGSCFVPRDETVSKLVRVMLERLQQLRKMIQLETDYIIDFHNEFVTYTILLVGFCTGYRAVHDPLLQKAEIDLTSGFAVISDKDDDSFFNARIVWLPPICLQQLEAYSEHLQDLGKYLFGINQRLFFKSRGNNITGRRAERSTPGLFYLDGAHEQIEVCPKRIETYLKSIGFSLPVNANRHYLRTNLIKAGCPIEIVNTFMGHAEMGQEPWGKHSGLSPHTYRDELSKQLVPLIAAGGWRVEPGYGSN